MTFRALAALALLTLAPRAWAATPFPARSGESGLLDVPDAEVQGVGKGLLGAELRFDAPATGPNAFGPLPVYTVFGVLERLDAGVTLREWGAPGDPRPTRLLFGFATKYQLAPSRDGRPALALDATVDRVGAGPVYGSRLIASTPDVGRLRFSAFVGGEAGDASGVTYGGAVAITHRSETELVLEALSGPRGPNLGAALRRRALRSLGVSLGVNYLPDDEGLQVSLGFAFAPGAAQKSTPVARPGEPPAAPEAPAEEPTLQGDRPRFALRIRTGELGSTDPRHLQHGPYVARTGPASTLPSRAPVPPRAAPLSGDEVLEAQLREAEALADARASRLSATADQLAARLAAAQDEERRLAARERDLEERARQLDARERRIASRGAPTQQQRQLESQEAQLAAQERQLAAQERSLAPALEAAQGREAEAAAREDAERQEQNRLVASATAARSRAEQLEVRRQALAARNRQLAAQEARLVALGERVDALELQLRTRAERLDAVSRRLDARAERLDLLDRRGGPQAGPDTAAPGAGAQAVAPKDRAVFVMVVKSPTAVVKDGAAPAAAGAQAEPVVPGSAVERAVAAAAVVSFPSPSSTLSELDAEAIEGVARLAARERCELLVWARAKDPAAMAEAQRRAAEIRSRVLAAAALEERQVVTRITTRPGAPGVDVVVSALRDRPYAGPAGAPASGSAPAQAAPAAVAPGFVGTETGRRLIRAAVVAAQPSIEACVAMQLETGQLARADGVLQLHVTVGPDGRPARVTTGGDVTSATLDACLQAAAASWRFPATGAEYDVDVPISLLRRGSAR